MTATPHRELIILAREARGYTQEMLADAIGVAQGTLSKVENGQAPPVPDLVGKIADALDFPVDFFSADLKVQELPPSFFRRRLTGVSQKAIKAIRANWAITLRSLAVLLGPVDFPDARIPQIDLAAGGRTPGDAARELRVHWHLPVGPVGSLATLLERNGVLVVPFDFGTERIDGMSVWEPSISLPPVLFINQRQSGERQRFTMAHELGHLMLHAHIAHALEDRDVEQEANAFASEFLVPADEVRAHLMTPTLQGLLSLKLYWRVSAMALLVKADDLGMLSPAQRDRAWKQVSRLGWRTAGEPNPLPPEEPSLLRQLLALHTDKLQYSEEDLCRLLHLNGKDLHARFPMGKHGGLRLV